MKKIYLSGLFGVGILAAIFSGLSGSEAARMQQSYALVCRGSANLEIDTADTAPGEENIGFVFTRGTKPAGEGLGPGECSWVDRGMHDDEPDRLSQHVSSKAGPNLPYEGPRLLPIHTKPWSELHSPDKYWTFMVYNDRQGQLIVTGARPNAEMSVSHSADSDPLVCRGAKTFEAKSTEPHPWSELERSFSFTFIRGSKPARDGLAPGECSWQDRGMRADEPDRLVQHGEMGFQNRWYLELHSPC